MSKTSQRVLAAKQAGYKAAEKGIKRNPHQRNPLRAAFRFGQRTHELVKKSLETYEPEISV